MGAQRRFSPDEENESRDLIANQSRPSQCRERLGNRDQAPKRKALLRRACRGVLARTLNGVVWPVLPVLPTHIPELLALPMHHRDPFDRLLIAQARAEGMALASADEQFRRYRVPMAW